MKKSFTIKVSAKEFRTATGCDDLPDDYYQADYIINNILKVKRSELVRAYAEASGMTEQEIEHEYEGGIDDWAGFGSVTCYELPCTTMVGMTEDDLVVTISNFQ